MSDLIRFALPRKTSRANLMVAWLSGGSIGLYDGTIPASAEDALTDQTTLAVFDPLPDPAGSAAAGVFALATGTAAATILATGTPDFARVFDSLGSPVGDFDVGEEGSGSALLVDNINLVEGALVSLLSLAVAEQ